MKTIFRILEWIPYVGIGFMFLCFFAVLTFDILGGFKKKTKFSYFFNGVMDVSINYPYYVIFLYSVYHAFFLLTILIPLFPCL
jgi:hypothetical protein